MYRLTGNTAYYEAFSQTLDFAERHHVAREGGGGPPSPRTAPGKGKLRSSPWQGAYHNGRALLLCAKLLEGLATTPG